MRLGRRRRRGSSWPPGALIGRLRGDNLGKMIVQVG